MQVELQQIVDIYQERVSTLSHELLITQIALANSSKEIQRLEGELENLASPEDF